MNLIADEILRRLKQYGDKRIKRYFYGDPIIINVSSLPALIVENASQEITQKATGQDEITNTYNIRLVFNKKSEIGKNPEEVSSERTIAQLVAGRDESGNYDATSIVGILRKYFTLGDLINDQQISIDYSIGERGDIITSEADILLTIKDNINLADRQ